MAFLAVADVRKSSDWRKDKSANDIGYAPTTREIIAFYDKYLGESLSPGSYDDIRRKDLKQLLIAGIVIPSKPSSNTSNPTRGYQINPVYLRIIRSYGQNDWMAQVRRFNNEHETYSDKGSPGTFPNSP